MAEKSSTQLIFIPSPGMGHLVAAVEMANLLLDRDDPLSVTMILIRLPSQLDVSAYVDNLSASTPTDMSERIEFIDLCKLDGYDSSAETNPGFVKTLFIESQKAQVRNVVAEIVRSNSGRPGSPRLAGFVIDMFCTTMIDVANEFGAPTFMFYASSAAFLGLMFFLQSRKDEHDMDATEFKNDPDAELAVPSFLLPVPASALPYLVVEKSCAPFLLQHTRRTREVKGIMVNSFQELESHAITSLCDGVLPKVYPVGPVLNLNRAYISSSSMLSSGTHLTLKWLDDQPNASVVFLCFGSRGSLHEDQVKEIAHALEHCGLRFLWSLRRPPQKAENLTYESPGVYENPRDVLPEGFIDRTAERGRVIGWAPQVDILSHPAIGGFVSHCGWNSILESIWFGVPIATLPLHAEQHLNAFEMVKELGLSVEIKLDYKSGFYCDNDRTIVGAQEIEEGIMRLMLHDSDVRKRVKEMSEKSRKVVVEGGSSYSSLGHLFNDLFNNF